MIPTFAYTCTAMNATKSSKVKNRLLEVKINIYIATLQGTCVHLHR